MRALGRSRLALVVLVVPVVMGVAACGSDDGAEPGAGGTAAGAAPTSPSPSAAAEVPENICDVVTAAGLSEALGVTVTTEVGPSGDCEFDEEDPRGLSGSVGAVGFADVNGGFDGYVSGLDASMADATASDVPGLQGKAVVKVGKPAYGGGSSLMAAGVVDRGSFLLQITLAQAKGLPDATLRTAASRALGYLDQSID